MNKIEKIKKYWEDPNTISIVDKNLHKLEIETACKYLKSTDILLDIGCGDAGATKEYSKIVEYCIGIEQSNTLQQKALQNTKDISNIEIREGNILNLKINQKFDVIITQRMLINLESWEDQKYAIRNIYNLLKENGTYIMIENTNEAFKTLNNMRSKVGLEPIKQHWHNLFFDYSELLKFMLCNFKLVNYHDFNLYYFLTRVYTQMFANFTGFGKNINKSEIFEKSDEDARILYEKYKNNIQFEECISPIQVFVFQKK